MWEVFLLTSMVSIPLLRAQTLWEQRVIQCTTAEWTGEVTRSTVIRMMHTVVVLIVA